MVAGQDGNVSVRLPGDRVLITPAGLSKVDVTPASLVEVTGDGRAVGRGEPSSEMAVHLASYRMRLDVMAVVHAHPPTATGFAVAGQPLEAEALAELAYNVGPVPLVPYEAPGSTALGEAVAAALRTADVVLLANHGAVAVGPTLTVALQRMESVEHAARILLTARLLGGVTRLTPEQTEELHRARLARFGAPRFPTDRTRARGRR